MNFLLLALPFVENAGTLSYLPFQHKEERLNKDDNSNKTKKRNR